MIYGNRGIRYREKGIRAVFVKRGRLEIIYDILSVCRNPVNKTRILYRCNLSFDLLQKYLEYLISHGMLTNNPEGSFQTTEKGKEFLKGYENVKIFLEG